ncbi:FAS1 domain-containing protein [Epithele typhae]|uniref:FAS1 domain-containing protein n=1 Tax=Epithele typhae TaxID=378194 RepID=UPI0020075707|nr:FAS1 domain-containing protein [Epithele typhae]XP_047878413.1 FAS1 domain-containing protein [Epithele typhae]KAH9913125.1 FAS1 domain-containing protein [Epithele typhae]KAH9933954.1 FAS1 domain-containing protein [Epithele typhae]
MRLFSAATLLFAACPVVWAQNATLVPGLIAALNAAGLTSLANITQGLNTTTTGGAILTQLQSGRSFLIFAPSNEALAAIPSNVSSNPEILNDIISYHIVQGNFSGVVTNYPNVTLGRTLLNDSRFVSLEGDQAQALAWANRSDGKFHILNQRLDPTIQNTTVFGNITVNVINHVLEIPGTFGAIVPQDSDALSGFQGVSKSVSIDFFNATSNSTANITLEVVLNNGLHGFTLFAANNTGLAAAQGALTGLGVNTPALDALLENHLINGSTVYSPNLVGGDRISAAGQTFSFSINSTGQYVTSGGTTALIVQPDVLLYNGVIHVIDRVLFNTDTNPSAASSAEVSALSSASVAATAEATPTGPIGFSATASLASATSTGTSSAAGARHAPPRTRHILQIAATMVGVLAGIVVIV